MTQKKEYNYYVSFTFQKGKEVSTSCGFFATTKKADKEIINEWEESIEKDKKASVVIVTFFKLLEE